MSKSTLNLNKILARLTPLIGISVIDLVLAGLLQLTASITPGWTGYAIASAGLALCFVAALTMKFGPTVWAHRVVQLYLVIIAAELIFRVGSLVATLNNYRGAEGGALLLLDSFLLWLFNILIFATSYWVLNDRIWSERGETQRHFFFPQQCRDLEGYDDWVPHQFDYIFLSFTISTSYGPTDTIIASRGAKALAMLQSLVALVLFTVSIAHAVGLGV
jgi:uncharacterized membrane protein